MTFDDLRSETHTIYILQNLNVHRKGRFVAFTQQLTLEQLQYFDRPSDMDKMVIRRGNDEDFPALNDLLTPVLHEQDIAVGIVAFMIHHVAYASALFQQTNHDLINEIVQALVEWRLQQISSMLLVPFCRMPLRARKYCATMNVRGAQELIIHRARGVLQHLSSEELGWHLYKWLVYCV